MQHVFILSSRSGSCYYSKESYSGQVNFLKISEIFRLKYNIYFSKKSRFPFYYLKFTVFEEKNIYQSTALTSTIERSLFKVLPCICFRSSWESIQSQTTQLQVSIRPLFSTACTVVYLNIKRSRSCLSLIALS